ncbi:Rho GTPase-activating protein 15, partial [Physocladia obscura]
MSAPTETGTAPGTAPGTAAGSGAEAGTGTKAAGLTARALWDYEAMEDNELSFAAGDFITVLELCNDDWYEGATSKDATRIGFFPANRVVLFNQKSPATPTAASIPSNHQTTADSQVSTADLPPIRLRDPTTSQPSSTRASFASSATVNPSSTRRQAPLPPPSRKSKLAADLLASIQSPTSTGFDSFQSNQSEIEPAPVTAATSLPSPPSRTNSDPFNDEILDENNINDLPAPSPVLKFRFDNDDDDGGNEDQVDVAGHLNTHPIHLDSNLPVDLNYTSPILGSLSSIGGSEWKTMRDEHGDVYYWNKSTNQTSWDAPSFVAATTISSQLATSSRDNNNIQSTTNTFSNPAIAGIAATQSIGGTHHHLARSSTAPNFSTSDDEINDVPLSDAHSTAAIFPELQYHRDGTTASNAAVTGAAVVTVSLDLDLTRFDQIPADMVMKEGAIKIKVSTKGDGKHSMLSSSWKVCYGVLCVGVLFLFKDNSGGAISGRGKKSQAPFDAINLDNGLVEVAGKDYTSKKHAFIYTTSRGVQRIFMTDTDSASLSWMDSIKECSKERHTVAECEAVILRIFMKARPPLPSSITISDPIPLTISPPAVANNDKLRMDGMPKSTSSSGGNGGGGNLAAATAAATSVTVTATATSSTRRSINVFSGGAGSGGSKDRQSDGGSSGMKFSFFGKKTSAPAVKSDVLKPERPFGGVLDAQLEFENRKIPLVVEQCIGAVEARDGIDVQGIYRLSGNSATVTKLKNAFNNGEAVDLIAEIDINVVTGLLKSYFRELQNPLIPYEFYDQFIASSKVPDYNERLIELKTLIQSLPQNNYTVLSYLIQHLRKIAEKSDVNKMEESNLAIVFAPTLIRTAESVGGDAAVAAQQGYLSMANMPFHNKLIE